MRKNDKLTDLLWVARIGLENLADGLNKWPAKQKQVRGAAMVLHDWIQDVNGDNGSEIPYQNDKTGVTIDKLY